jgi:hypothetical protein
MHPNKFEGDIGTDASCLPKETHGSLTTPDAQEDFLIRTLPSSPELRPQRHAVAHGNTVSSTTSLIRDLEFDIGEAHIVHDWMIPILGVANNGQEFALDSCLIDNNLDLV